MAKWLFMPKLSGSYCYSLVYHVYSNVGIDPSCPARRHVHYSKLGT